MSKQFKGSALLLGEDAIKETSTLLRDVQLLRTGSFFDDRYDNFKITRKMFQEMISNFKTGVRGIQPAVDYGHDTEGVAAGWMKDVYETKVQGDQSELWAKVEWTPKGQKTLSDKEFGYLSADFDTAYEDNETKKKYGCVLLGAGLTNRPVIKKMQPAIQLSEATDLKCSNDKQKEKIVDAEKEKQLADATAKLGEQDAQLAGYKKLAEDMGAKSPEELMKIIADMKAKQDAGASAEQKEMGQVKQQLAELKKDKKDDDFKLLLSEGKACEGQREAFMSGDVAGFAKNADAKAMKLSEMGHGKNSTGGTSTTEKDVDDQIHELAEKMVSETKISLNEAYSKVIQANPKLAEQRK